MSEKKREVWLFGNPDFDKDSLPVKIATNLEERLTDFTFVIKDPHEEWAMPEKLIIVDTVQGIKEVKVFTSLNDFANSPRVTMHDFDLITNLKWLNKLGKLPPFLIIGVPADINEESAVKEIVNILRKEN